MSIKFYLIVAQRLPFCFCFFSFSKLNLEKMYNSSFRIDSFNNFHHYQVWCSQFRILFNVEKRISKWVSFVSFRFLVLFSIYFFFFFLLSYSIYVILNLNSKIYLIKFVFVLFCFFFSRFCFLLIFCCLVNICLKLSSFIVFCGLCFFFVCFYFSFILYIICITSHYNNY